MQSDLKKVGIDFDPATPKSIVQPVLNAEPLLQETIVRVILSHLDDAGTLCSEVIAWLYRYHVVPLKLVLQTYCYTREQEIFRICGTDGLEEDTKLYLGIDSTAAEADADADGPDKRRGPAVDVDIPLDAGHENGAQKRRSEQTISAKRANPIGMNAVERALASQVSVLGAAKEITQSGGDVDECVATVCAVCLKSKSYNRFFGSVAGALMDANERWKLAFAQHFALVFTESAENLGPDELRILGTFYGHLMCTGLEWDRVFASVSLDPKASTPSNRILLIALLNELKGERGADDVASSIRGLRLAALTDGQLARKFWAVAGLNVV